MGRGMAIAGPVMAAVFGVFTAYSAFQPELIKEQARREELDPKFASQHTPPEHEKHVQEAAEAQRDTAISRAMAQDFKEAGQQITQGGGFAWGIRKAIFGSKDDNEKK